MTKDVALYQFFSGFGLDTYVQTNVPTDAQFPYLTYTPVFDSWGNNVAITVNLWYLTDSERIPNAKAQEIADKIGSGVYIPCDGGAILINRGTPFVQPLADDTNPSIKRRYINLIAEFLTLN